MNKKIAIISLGTIVGIVLILVFSLKIFEKIYFNEKYYKVPNLKGLTLSEGKELLKNTELNLKEMGEEYSSLPIGEIFLQEPVTDLVVKKGRNIKVWVSKGAALVDVPKLTGMNYLDAKVIAEQKGLIIENVVTVKGKGGYNEVMATDPASNTLMTRGEKISFLVNGAEEVVEVRMPDIIGVSFDKALEILSKNRLIVGKVDFISIPGIEKNVIIESSVKVGNKVPAGASVDLKINN